MDAKTEVVLNSAGRLASVNGYEVSKQLGKGAFGEVYLASRGGEQFALKIIKKAALKKTSIPGRPGTKQSPAALDLVKAEIATLKKIGHPNCVHMLDVIYDPTVDQVFLVLEFVDGGTSQKSDEEGHPIPLPERTIWSHSRHFVMGLEYLHMQGIVHRDIKPENLMLTAPGKMYKGAAGVLKITDFGTAALCEGDANVQRTMGTPPFFSPELCASGSVGSFDARVVDLWAFGVTLYLWVSGRLPFIAPTVMLLMEKIRDAPAQVPSPPEASAALGGVIESLLTHDSGTRLTLSQLRHHSWLTDDGAQPLPIQPVVKIEVTAEEIEVAVSNRAAIAKGSAAGPSAFGAALELLAQGSADGGWKREGLSTIRKRTTAEGAAFWRSICASGHLSPHVPLLYSIGPVDEDGDGEVDVTADGRSELYDVRVHDLVAAMTEPCAMGIVMGTRTLTSLELTDESTVAELGQPQLLEALTAIDSTAPTVEEVRAGGVSPRRFLSALDALSSTSSLGFRIDAARTVIEAGATSLESKLGALPLPEGTSFSTLKEEADIIAAFCTFFQSDVSVATAALRKVQTLHTALTRSPFFARHVFLRSQLLLIYDDEARTSRIELKMRDFAFSYPLPEGSLPEGATLTHSAPWEGTAESHEDGYLLGIRSLERILGLVCEQLGQAVG